MNAPLVLVVDDDPRVGIDLSRQLERGGFRFAVAQDLRRARSALARLKPDAVLLDLCLPDGSGMDLLPEIKRDYPDTAIVLLTAFGSVEAAVEAIKAGADDFVLKSIAEHARIAVCNALERRRLAREVVRLRKLVGQESEALLFRCAAMKEVLDKASQVAPYEVNVLLEGESGTGKELLARILHDKSARRDGPFVPIDCAALPEGLFESELFGHEKGAFTGADRQHSGRLERAQGGTIFLDEIGNLPVRTQVKLLRVLQERSMERLGGTKPISLNIRVVCATNVDLEAAIRQGLFRTDLYYRLNEVSLFLPPLRERQEDILLLAERFLAQYTENFSKRCLTLSETARQSLCRYPWPGNVRELKNAIKTAVIFSDREQIELEHLSPAIRRHSSASSACRIDKRDEPEERLTQTSGPKASESRTTEPAVAGS